MITAANVSKWAAITGMVLSCGWFVGRWKEPGFPWEASTTFVAALAALITIELRSSKRRLSRGGDVSVRNDAELFRQLQDLLPSHGVIAFIKEHDFGGSFFLNRLEPIGGFCHDWDNPQHEFADPRLEMQREKLLRAANYFAIAIAKNTAPRANGLQSAIPRQIDSDGPFPQWVKRDIHEIHQAAAALVDEHEKMMRLGRRTLPLANGQSSRR